MADSKWPQGEKSLSIPLPPRFSQSDLRHRQRVCQQGGDTPKRTVRLVKDAQLPKERRAVVVDPLARQALGIVECKDPAERKLDLSAGCRQPAPRSQVLSANDDLEHDGGVAGVSMQHVNPQSGQRLQHS